MYCHVGYEDNGRLKAAFVSGKVVWDESEGLSIRKVFVSWELESIANTNIMLHRRVCELSPWNFVGIYKEREVGYSMNLRGWDRTDCYVHTEASHYIARFFVTHILLYSGGATYCFHLMGSKRWDHELFTPHIKRHNLSWPLQWRAHMFSLTL